MREFHTTDLGIAAALVYFNIKLTDVVPFDESKPFRKMFVFEESPQLKEVVEKYWAKELLVEPQAFHLAIKELKARLHDGV